MISKNVVISNLKLIFYLACTIIFFTNNAIGLNNEKDGFQIERGDTAILDVHSDCKSITNNSGHQLFIPTKHRSQEWEKFKSHASSIGVTLSDCAGIFWRVSAWSPCDITGTQTRTVVCEEIAIGAPPTIVDNSLCELSMKPVSIQTAPAVCPNSDNYCMGTTFSPSSGCGVCIGTKPIINSVLHLVESTCNEKCVKSIVTKCEGGNECGVSHCDEAGSMTMGDTNTLTVDCAPGEGLCPDLVDCEVVWSKPVIAPVNTCSVACQRESIQTCNVSVDHCGPFSCKMGDRYITMVSNCSPGDGLCPPSCLIISGSDVTINLEACKLDPGSFDINFDLPIVDPGSPGMGVWRGFDPGGFN
ncbi:MAG: hypothetical protein ISR65_11970 [Bacteriovoracaceae bacterium]|nr:hypothetical protein [Bacteriovoracaceae bacterium]